MLTALKRVLLAALALAATTAMTPSAIAQSEPLPHSQIPGVAVFQEVAGSDPFCPAVTPAWPPLGTGSFATSGGCRVHMSSLGFQITAHVFGIESTDSTCNIEFNMRIDGGGEGYLSHFELTQGSQGTCTRRACSQTEGGSPPPTGQTEGRPWSFYIHEDEPGQEALTALMCIQPRNDPAGARTHCEVTLPITHLTLHRMRLTSNDKACHGTGGFRGEVTIDLFGELGPDLSGENQAEQSVELLHT